LESYQFQFPRGDPDQVKSAVFFLAIWNNDLHTTQRHTENRDLSEWARDLYEAEDQSVENYDLILNKVQMMYRYKEICHNSATKAKLE
jgi:hypothetical protein